MSAAQSFLLYNLLPSLLAGLVAWTLTMSGMRLLRIDHGALRLSLLSIPLAKSLLVLAGIGIVLPWPRDVFELWRSRALPFGSVLPYLLVLIGISLVGQPVLSRRSRREALRAARPAGPDDARLVAAFERAAEAFERRHAILCAGTPGCCAAADHPRPRLMVSEGRLHTPTAVTEGDPVIVFPAGLVDRLGDTELEGALAHEMAHFRFRRISPCTAANLHRFSALTPVAILMASQVRREEEKACDDLTVQALGRPETYADMLLKSYRYAVSSGGPLLARLRYAPQLLGIRSMLSERIERLVGSPSPQANLGAQRAASCLLMAALLALLFWN